MRLGTGQFGGGDASSSNHGSRTELPDVWELLFCPARMYFQMPKGGIHL